MTDFYLRAKLLGRALELLAKRLGCDPSVLANYLEGRSELPTVLEPKLKAELEDADAIYFEVVDDPLNTPEGQLLRLQMIQLAKYLSAMLGWLTPYGLHKTRDGGYYLVNIYGVQVSPKVQSPEDLRHLTIFRQDIPDATYTPSVALANNELSADSV